MFKEKHMRSIAQWGLFAAAGLLAGCQINPYTQSQRFTTWSDVDITPRPVRFPIIATFPDETMFFYPIWTDTGPRADLNLRAIGCTRLDNGKLVVTARVQNMGADIITTNPLAGDTAFPRRRDRDERRRFDRKYQWLADRPAARLVDRYPRAQFDARLRR